MEPGSAAANLRRLVLGPALAIVLVYVLPALSVAALAIFLRGLIDSALIAFAGAALGVLGCGVVLRAASWIWRRGAQSSLLTGFMVLWAFSLVAGTQLFLEFGRALARAHEASSTTSSLSATSLEPTSSLGPGALDTFDPFSDCMNRLAEPAVYESARRMAAPAGSLADDVVHVVLLRVCGRHARSRIRDLPTYFRTSVKHAAWKVDSGEWNPRTCAVEELCGVDFETDYLHFSSLGIAQAAICNLESAQQRRVIELRLDGEPFAVIGATLGISADHARQIHKRGVERIKSRLSGCK